MTGPLSVEQLTALVAKAEAATPGPWVRSKVYGLNVISEASKQILVRVAPSSGSMAYPEAVAESANAANTEFIAAASPDVVLALVAAVRASVSIEDANRVLAEERDAHERSRDELAAARTDADEARAEAERINSALALSRELFDVSEADRLAARAELAHAHRAGLVLARALAAEHATATKPETIKSDGCAICGDPNHSLESLVTGALAASRSSSPATTHEAVDPDGTDTWYCEQDGELWPCAAVARSSSPDTVKGAAKLRGNSAALATEAVTDG